MIVDILMPEKRGIETIMEIQRDFPHTKIIAMSGGGKVGGQFCLEVAEKLGIDSVLEKPLNLKEFIASGKIEGGPLLTFPLETALRTARIRPSVALILCLPKKGASL